MRRRHQSLVQVPAQTFVHRKHLARVGPAEARAWQSGARGEVVAGHSGGIASPAQGAGAQKAYAPRKGEGHQMSQRLTFGLLTTSHHLDVHMMRTKREKRTVTNEGMY